jgi:hypothetical protein
MIQTILIVVVAVAVLAVGFIMLTRRDPPIAPSGTSTASEDIDSVVSEPSPVEGTAHLAEADRVTWTEQFNPSSGALGDDARLRLIEDLGLLRAAWCVPLLEQACHQEFAPALRAAAQHALSCCHEQTVKEKPCS